MGDASDLADVVENEAVMPGLQESDIDDHIDLVRPVEDRAPRFVCFHVGRRRPQWKACHGADSHAGSSQQLGAQLHPGGIHAYRGKSELRGFFAELPDLHFGSIRLEQRMIDVLREIVGNRRGAEVDSESFSPALDEPPQPVRTLVHAIGAAFA